LTHDDWTILTGDWPGPRSSSYSTLPLDNLDWSWDSSFSSPIVTTLPEDPYFDML
jgi:hypothetical protein